MSDSTKDGLLADLRARGLIYQSTNDEALEKLFSDPQKKLAIYAGFDPTAPDLHLGNLLCLVTLERLRRAGHTIFPIIGGATGFIGDPSGRNSERSLLDKETITANAANLKDFLENFFGPTTKILNNYDWLEKISILDFLRDIGKHFTLGYLLDKETIRARLENGISITETNYLLLQAYDFWYLFKNHSCNLEIGGADQWGNITAGIDYIRRREQTEVYGFTYPLLTTPDGQKFGKSAGNAIWLNSKLTHPYTFYQFLLNTPDTQVIDLLKKFTFLSLPAIESLAIELASTPEKRSAQKSLAREVTSIVHGSLAADNAEKISSALFSGQEKNLIPFCDSENSIWLIESLPHSNFKNPSSLMDILVSTGLSSSKRQAREDISTGAIYINGERATDPENILDKNSGLNNSPYIFLRKGKKTYHLLIWSK